MGTSDDGYVRMNAPAWDAERETLAKRPERGAATSIKEFVVDPAAFGTVPGGSATAGRLGSWGDRSRTEMDRVTGEVTALVGVCQRAGDLCRQGEERSTAAANSARPN